MIEELVQQADEIANGKHATVRPGKPFHFKGVESIGDGVWQGDVGICVVDDSVEGLVEILDPKDLCVVLDPLEDTVGSRHILDSLDGVKWYNPGQDASVLTGPKLICVKDRVITHPVHGNVHLLAGQCYQTRYPRVYDEELRTERRNAD